MLLSLSIALGILVSNLSGYGFLTTAHACGEAPATVIGDTLALGNALAPSGVAVHNIFVNGQLVESGVIANPVRFVGGNVVNANGVVVGNEAPTGPNGVVVGNDISVSGHIVSLSGTAKGGTLTGDNITIANGVITGQNLLLSGSTIDGGFININGTITGVSITPAN